MPLLETRKLSKHYGANIALGQVDFAAEAGEIHAIVGANGAGKSTLMNLLSGAQVPSSGQVLMNGKPVRLRAPADAQALGIATVYQEFSLVPQLSVARNVYLGREPRRGFGVVDHARLLRDTAALFKEYDIRLDPSATVARLSVAEQQMVELARALSAQSRIIILDEPTAVLSFAEQKGLFDIMRHLRAQGHLILFVSHRLEEVLDISDRVSVIRDGRLIGTRPTSTLQIPDIVEMMIGRAAHAGRVTQTTPEGPARFELHYETPAGEQSLALKSGEIIGLAGFVGSGRTSFAKALVGRGPPGVSARVLREGRVLPTGSPRAALQSGIIYLTEDRKSQGIFRAQSIIANASAASLSLFSRGGVLNHRHETRAAGAMLEQLHLVAARLDLPIERLSGGNQQKVLLARAIMSQPELLFIDEPTRGVDVGAKAEIHRIIAALAAQGAVVVVISSEIEELLALTHRIVVKKDRRFVAEFVTTETNQTDILIAASGGAQERNSA